ncbi:helix-turn-helix transcriptional regulator [Liquorilactobacillus sicerae]|uniref:helix-turn-helix transcriptional regulator n=1 Tax=Liquorilactobacillus sicerae TaxID=1416943 RepID=UPI00247FA2FD|nr:AraC family transcriptional regulator [Liquorilactobacillus sicerae]
MYHVLVISENRILLRQLWQWLANQPNLIIQLVPFSTDALTAFSANQVDLIIIDANILLPYQEILNDLTKAPWNYGVLFLGKDLTAANYQHPLISLKFKQLNPTTLKNAINRLLQRLNHSQPAAGSLTLTTFQSATELPYGTYHLLWIKTYTQAINSSEIKRLQKSLQLKFLTLIKLNKSDELLVLINRAQLNSQLNFIQLKKELIILWGANCSCVYRKNIASVELKQQLIRFKQLQDLRYFLGGEIIMAPIKPQTNSLNLTLIEQCLTFSQTLFNGNLPTAQHLLQAVYLDQIKPQRSFVALAYLRLQISFFIYLTENQEIKPVAWNFATLEDELHALLKDQFWQKIKYHSPIIKTTLNQCLQVIWQHFSQGWSLKETASQLAINKTYLNRIYKEQFQLTIAGTYTWLRLEFAKIYLCYSTATIAQAAAAAGFKSVSYFNRVFKNRYQTTPKSYQEKMRKGAKLNYYEDYLEPSQWID